MIRKCTKILIIIACESNPRHCQINPRKLQMFLEEQYSESVRLWRKFESVLILCHSTHRREVPWSGWGTCEMLHDLLLQALGLNYSILQNHHLGQPKAYGDLEVPGCHKYHPSHQMVFVATSVTWLKSRYWVTCQ